MAWNLYGRNLNYWRFRFPQIILMGTTGTITGTASPLAFVKLCPSGPFTNADGSGAFRLDYIPIGTYRIISYNPERTLQGFEDIEVETNLTTNVVFSYSPTSDPGCP